VSVATVFPWFHWVKKKRREKERKRGRILGVLAVVYKPFYDLFVQAKI
jgi:hypothetical protein